MQVVVVAGIDRRFVTESGDRPSAERGVPQVRTESAGRSQVVRQIHQPTAEPHDRFTDRSVDHGDAVDGIDVNRPKVPMIVLAAVRGGRSQRVPGPHHPHVQIVMLKEELEQPDDARVDVGVVEICQRLWRS
ncbi:MAG TPA: hypothetical protein IAA98_12765 [Candidatus Avipropionibacterium avicola]|uniref:Uncharacterized protein n=1 Tax=Candidatus Avipropionibacterium avicola TaxID=2840701 RepID=A0A9D1GZQ3_9ACTN|nr:hypothetical protein [Candidatus Avipropionibacterium avicola]